MKQFRLVDNALGWLAFLIAAFVYCSTIEPTASFWDCPEFITTGYKLEIGHPPGAPFFMLTANLFSQFASDPTQVAKMVNTMSALLSATCILFLFWSITHLVRRLLIDKWEDLTLDQGSCELRCGGKSVRMTGKLYQLAELFLENPRILFSVQQLMDKVWGWDTEAEINVVWVNISQLRKKLAELDTVTEIRVHRGTGYSLEKKTEDGAGK